jgi:hypothetical protein
MQNTQKPNVQLQNHKQKEKKFTPNTNVENQPTNQPTKQTNKQIIQL